MNCTLFSYSETELQEASSELPAYAEGDTELGITTAPVGKVLELGESWNELHATLGEHGDDHPLGFLAAGGTPVQSMQSDSDTDRSFSPIDTVQLLAWVARLDDPSVRKLRHFLADAVLARQGIIVHHFR
jgi:hypothetical protein